MRIETVLGSISPIDLGITLLHEHILVAAHPCQHADPVEPWKKTLVDAPVTIENLGILHYDENISKDNLISPGADVAIEELTRFRERGGCSVVDSTLPGMWHPERSYAEIQRIAKTTELNIILCAGWYIQPTHPPFIARSSIEDLSELMIRDLTVGIENTGIKAGAIGEIGCSYPMHPDEEKVLAASSRAQERTDAGLFVHPPIWYWKPRKGKVMHKLEDIINLVEKEGVNLKKFVLLHVDQYSSELDYVHRILERGVTIAFDNIGHETFHSSIGVGNPTDRERASAITSLCSEGYETQILLSQDVFLKTQTRKYGGYGYAHILDNFIPTLKRMGVKDQQVNTMMIQNPKHLLTF